MCVSLSVCFKRERTDPYELFMWVVAGQRKKGLILENPKFLKVHFQCIFNDFSCLIDITPKVMSRFAFFGKIQIIFLMHTKKNPEFLKTVPGRCSESISAF